MNMPKMSDGMDNSGISETLLHSFQRSIQKYGMSLEYPHFA